MSGDYQQALQKALSTFYVEAGEMLEQMEQTLLALEDSPKEPELLNALFRSIHTIKGSAGLFGLNAIVAFTHQVETLLDQLRSGEIELSPSLSSLLLQCCDHVTELVAFARSEGPETALPSGLEATSDALLKSLLAFQPGGQSLPVVEAKGSSSVATVTSEGGPEAGRRSVWHISLRFHPECHLRGIDPLATIRYLGTLGDLDLSETIDEAVPRLSELDPERCHLGFELRLSTTASRREIESAFEFIEDDCDVRLISPKADPEEYIRLIQALPQDSGRLGEILLACRAISEKDLHRALAVHHMESLASERRKPLGEVLVENRLVAPAVVDAALRKQAQGRERTEEMRVFRVQAEKLDALIDLVGELVIVSAAARNQSEGNPSLQETTHHMGRLVEEIRNSSLALRMVPVDETFSKFRRVVRDLSSNLGKEVRLDIEGGDTELDKSVVEKISDPLMHLVRNALDHGLETPAEREAAGKPRECRLCLAARHDSGSIVIRVSDDGRGIDTDRVLAKARSKGLVAEGATLSEEAIHALIFEPGFSTADTVTDISGRGVGMDVVRQNVEKLRGRIAIRSQRGLGTQIEIRLPLTLAIIDGFLVRCGSAVLAIPLENIDECLSAAGMGEGQQVISQRGVPLPILDVARSLGIPSAAAAARRSIVIVNADGIRAGLLVDQLIGEHQTVIKPLGKVFSRIRPLSGSTILGSGEIALILDVSELLRTASKAPPMRALTSTTDALLHP
jgi:two-component system chemotaxis sensor kinase CheA